MDEVATLLANGNVTDCLSQTWCYYNKYKLNSEKQSQSDINRWDETDQWLKAVNRPNR